MSNPQGIARAPTTSSQLFSFKEERLLTGFEHLLLQGYSSETRVPGCISESELRSMAGEAIALPPLAVVIWSLFLTKGVAM